MFEHPSPTTPQHCFFQMLLELENLQHRSLPKQPDCLTVELYEHQKQDAQWMMDQEMLEGGSMQHIWAEMPAPPLAPSVRACCALLGVGGAPRRCCCCCFHVEFHFRRPCLRASPRCWVVFVVVVFTLECHLIPWSRSYPPTKERGT